MIRTVSKVFCVFVLFQTLKADSRKLQPQTSGAKLGLIGDIFSASTEPLCSYILRFTRTLNHEELNRLVKFLALQLLPKEQRHLEESLLSKRGFYTMLGRRFRRSSCKLAWHYLRKFAKNSFRMFLKFIDDLSIEILLR